MNIRRKIEDIVRGYVPASKTQFREIAEALAQRKNTAELSIPMSSNDLKAVKQIARRLGVSHQVFIADFLHHVATS